MTPLRLRRKRAPIGRALGSYGGRPSAWGRGVCRERTPALGWMTSLGSVSLRLAARVDLQATLAGMTSLGSVSLRLAARARP